MPSSWRRPVNLSEAVAALSDQRRINQITLPDDRYIAIAQDYLRSHRAGQRTLVVSPAIEERSELNRVIRELLVKHDVVAREGIELRTLTSVDLTRAQRAHARHYAVGDVIRFRRGSAKFGYRPRRIRSRSKNRMPNVICSDCEAKAARALSIGQANCAASKCSMQESRTIAVGDRIQFRAPDRALGIANGEFATVVESDADQTRLCTDSGREIAAANSRLRHLDYGYASTSHASQGATVDRVIVNIDTAAQRAAGQSPPVLRFAQPRAA